MDLDLLWRTKDMAESIEKRFVFFDRQSQKKSHCRVKWDSIAALIWAVKPLQTELQPLRHQIQAYRMNYEPEPFQIADLRKNLTELRIPNPRTCGSSFICCRI
jgi:hypothetical protein